MASEGQGGDFEDFSLKKDAKRNRKQKRREQKRQDLKARRAGQAERAADRGSAQYGYGSSASAGPRAMRRVSDEGSTG